jgi:exodeoxyribonuclease VII small subunit
MLVAPATEGSLMNESSADHQPFEEALVELERTVRDLEDGRLGLDEALARYEQGVGLVRRCYTQLREAEQRILLLTGVDDNQQPILTPFKHEATAKPDLPRRRKD